jgi:hypothetical protein
MLGASEYWITVVELENFTRVASQFLTEDEIAGLVTYLANHPDEGIVIPDTGGVRKIRWPAQGLSESSGTRIVYFFRDLNMPLYLLTAFGKGESIALSKAEKAELRVVVEEIVHNQWSGQVEPRVVRLSNQR